MSSEPCKGQQETKKQETKQKQQRLLLGLIGDKSVCVNRVCVCVCKQTKKLAGMPSSSVCAFGVVAR